MQPMVSEEPYRFIPPVHGKFWPRLLTYVVPTFVDRAYGVADVEFRGVGHVRDSIAKGRAVVLAPNHCRPADPLVVGMLIRETGSRMYAMATSNLFRESALQRFFLRRCGAFSVYREGFDRASTKEAIANLAAGDRFLLLFPEGIVARTNDRVLPLLEGTGFIAAQAAKRRGEPVAVHPTAIRYFFQGDDAALAATMRPVVEKMEERFVIHTNTSLRLRERIERLDSLLVAVKEIEYFGRSQTGDVAARRADLVERLLGPLEQEWNAGRTDDRMALRLKKLRSTILADMVAGRVDEAERRRRWRHLQRIYDAQRVSNHPPQFYGPETPRERLLETLERLEEDAYDKSTIHRPWKAVVQFGAAIEINSRRADEQLLAEGLRQKIQSMLDELASESRPISE